MTSRLFHVLPSIFAIALFSASPSASAFKIAYTVGNVGSCDFANLSDAVAAAAANPPHNIFVSANATAQAIRIGSQTLSITGGFQNCDDMSAPTGKSTISGAGNGGQDSVFYIFGTSNVTLSNLTISGGNLPSEKTGGGVSFQGNGALTISNSSVINNTAGSGGGINVNGSGGALTLTIGENVFITGNKALNSSDGDDDDHAGGGGIRIEGNTRLFMLADGIFVAQNHATSGNGGGLLVVGPARADIGSPGAGSAGVISDNVAVNGGGVSIEGGQGDGQDAVVRLFSTDATRPISISANAASGRGGGVFLKPNISFSSSTNPSHTSLCAYHYRIGLNIASDGSAVYADTESSALANEDIGSEVNLMTNGIYCDSESPEPLFDLGALPCSASADCNLIDGNQALDVNNNNDPTDGATVYVSTSSTFYAFQLKMRENNGGYLLRNGAADVDLDDCLIAENHLHHELILAESQGIEDYRFAVGIYNCTLANNQIGATHVIRTDNNTSILNSIIDEAGTLALAYPSDTSNLSVANVLSNDITTLPAGSDVVQGDPSFRDLTHGDYHLTATTLGGQIAASEAIDFAIIDSLPNDLDGRPRNVNFTAISNRFGPRDLGAYEMQPITDRIFGDAFGDPMTIVF